jgi:hypothetical protein
MKFEIIDNRELDLAGKGYKWSDVMLQYDKIVLDDIRHTRGENYADSLSDDLSTAIRRSAAETTASFTPYFLTGEKMIRARCSGRKSRCVDESIDCMRRIAEGVHCFSRSRPRGVQLRYPGAIRRRHGVQAAAGNTARNTRACLRQTGRKIEQRHFPALLRQWPNNGEA